MISEADAEKAVDWLRDNAAPAAKARAERIYMEAWVKTALAQEMQKHGSLPVAAQEREGRTSPGYLAALQALREAVDQDERNRFLREAAAAKLDAWRTQESTRRAEGRAG